METGPTGPWGERADRLAVPAPKPGPRALLPVTAAQGPRPLPAGELAETRLFLPKKTPRPHGPEPAWARTQRGSEPRRDFEERALVYIPAK